MVTVIFKSFDGAKQWICDGEEGVSLLQLAHDNGIDIEGACEGNMACSTCHLIVCKEDYEKLPAPCEEEDEMLDLAYGLTQTSRLGCQIIVTPALEGMVVTLPAASRNMMGF